MTQRPAIFLDRDGTIIRDVGYIKDPSQVDFYPFTVQALKDLQEHYTLIIITNQSGIANGFITNEEVEAVNQYIDNELKANGVTITQTYVCPHREDDHCYCRKPSPFYIKLAAIKHAINLPASFMIGDHPSDVACAMNADVWPIYLLTGHGEKHRKELKFNTIIKKDLREAADYILSR